MKGSDYFNEPRMLNELGELKTRLKATPRYTGPGDWIKAMEELTEEIQETPTGNHGSSGPKFHH